MGKLDLKEWLRKNWITLAVLLAAVVIFAVWRARVSLP